jgi:hypothetical protein
MAMFLMMGHAMLQKQNATIKKRFLTLSPILILENEKIYQSHTQIGNE